MTPEELAAEVERLQDEVDRYAAGMRQLLELRRSAERQRDEAEALIEDVRGKARVGDWPGIVDLLAEKEG